MHEAFRPLSRALMTMLAALTLSLGPFAVTPVAAQTPASTPSPSVTPAGVPGRPQPTDEQALAVERQLLCPLCVNERLDVCTLALCNDMKQLIRERLAAGSTPDDIILFFETRYGPKVRADLPREGFNLVLFGWVGGALALSAAAGAYALYSLRRDSRRRAAAVTPAGTAGDDRWVDALVDEAADNAPPSPGVR